MNMSGVELLPARRLSMSIGPSFSATANRKAALWLLIAWLTGLCTNLRIPKHAACFGLLITVRLIEELPACTGSNNATPVCNWFMDLLTAVGSIRSKSTCLSFSEKC
jgi:hypothetical protein